MPSNAAVPKLSHVPRKRPTQKHYLNTAGDTMAFNFINTPLKSPKKHPKTKDQPLSKTTSNDYLILLLSLLASTNIITIAAMIFSLLIIKCVIYH